MINEIQLIEEFEKTTFTDQNQKKQYGDLLNYLIDNVPKVEKCGDCSRRKFYQQGYKDGLNENKWILCSDKMPPNEKEVEITYVCKRWKTEEFLYFTTRAFYTDGTILTEDSNFVWYADDDWEFNEEYDCYVIPEGWWEYSHFSEEFGVVDYPVIAWRPLWEPYKPEPEEKKYE